MLEKEELLRYMKDAISQETAILQQETMIAEYDKISEKRKPQMKQKEIPDPPTFTKKLYMGDPYSPLTAIFAIYVIVCCIISIIGFVRMIIGEGAGLFVGSTIILMPGLLKLFSTYMENKRRRANYSDEYKLYSENKTVIQEKNNLLLREYQKNLCHWERSNHDMHEHMERSLIETKNLLKRLYATDAIYPKYQTLPALTSIYEYFITGRCEELTGPHGAYNLYEDELRKDTVISQLNTVIENLEQIKQNQYMLYQQVKAIQENTAAITYELQQIKGYTIQIAQLSALNAYYAALNEQNTRITMYYHL